MPGASHRQREDEMEEQTKKVLIGEILDPVVRSWEQHSPVRSGS